MFYVLTALTAQSWQDWLFVGVYVSGLLFIVWQVVRPRQ